MIAITKGMFALSALMSAGFVTAYDAAFPHPEDQSAAVQISHRFPQAGETFQVVKPGQPTGESRFAAARKGDKLSATGCVTAWPYIAQECLVSADGTPLRTVARYVTVERRTGENSSELMRTAVADVALR